MAPRHVALVGSAVVVLGMVIYLALEVGRAPVEPAVATTPLAVSPTHSAAVTESGDGGDGGGHDASGERPNPGRSRITPTVITRVPPAPSSAPATGTAAPTAPPALGTAVVAVQAESVMAQANKAYDKGDLDEARTFARKALEADPTNPRMLRILVSSACIEGDAGEAQKHFALLPAGDQDQMRTRCERYGVTFK